MGKHPKKFQKAAKIANPPMDEADFMERFEEARLDRKYTRATEIARAACKAFPESWDFLFMYLEARYNDQLTRWKMPDWNVLDEIERKCGFIVDAMEGRAERLEVKAPEKEVGPYVLRAFVSMSKGDWLAENKKPEEAREAFLGAEEQFIDMLQHPLWRTDLHVLAGYAEVLTRLGADEKPTGETLLLAKESFQKAMALGTESDRIYPVCVTGYAILLMRNNEDAEALNVFNTALERCPRHPRLLQGRDVASERLSGGGAKPKLPIPVLMDEGKGQKQYGGPDFDVGAGAPSKVQLPIRTAPLKL